MGKGVDGEEMGKEEKEKVPKINHCFFTNKLQEKRRGKSRKKNWIKIDLRGTSN